MEAPLDPGTATADLITDILAPTLLHQPAQWEAADREVCELVRVLLSPSDPWKAAWKLTD
jgi:hypothetical protein